jgi:STE24 endopeptidase
MKRLLLISASLAVLVSIDADGGMSRGFSKGVSPTAAPAAQHSIQSAAARTPRDRASEQPALRNSPAPDRFRIEVTPEMRRHSRIEETLYFASQLYGAAVLLLMLAAGISRRLRDIAERIARWSLAGAALYFALFAVTTTVLSFPLDYYAGFIVPHQFDLTSQSFGGWLTDAAKGLGVGIALGAPVAALALFAIRRFRRWWLVLWLGSVPLILIGIVIWPLFVDPLFNQFVPLRDPVLRGKLLEEAGRAGIAGSRVYEVDKSKQTKEMNAYVTGLGPSKRIVLWDTLLSKMTHDEILAVMGHEMGHYVLHHLWKGFAFSLAVSFVVFLIGQRIAEWGIVRFGPRWGCGSAADPAALPWLFLVLSIITFLLSPVISGFSRWEEHQADQFGLELTHLNEASATAFIKFAEDSKQDPWPSRFIEWWIYSHPPLGRRVEFALHYRPWESGKPNELWKP